MKPHKSLLAWKESFFLVKEIYSLTKLLPDEEKYGLTSQIRRAAVSIPCNIAEGAARNTKKEFKRFLHIASGSASELDTLLLLCTELEYIDSIKQELFIEKLDRISKLIIGLINKLKE